jgi:hypothetical protein
MQIEVQMLGPFFPLWDSLLTNKAATNIILNKTTYS